MHVYKPHTHTPTHSNNICAWYVVQSNFYPYNLMFTPIYCVNILGQTHFQMRICNFLHCNVNPFVCLPRPRVSCQRPHTQTHIHTHTLRDRQSCAGFRSYVCFYGSTQCKGFLKGKYINLYRCAPKSIYRNFISDSPQFCSVLFVYAIFLLVFNAETKRTPRLANCF